ncbi:MAG TPA: FKBP-type peptidyl-prolyl cis-trans isomerase [Planctomycetota bacterium]|jgi:peptidylprolyl isomerase|nr:FKBP-type peptidyl-prolyl cis-trans isomerase [Planctomycetota bacterium]
MPHRNVASVVAGALVAFVAPAALALPLALAAFLVFHLSGCEAGNTPGKSEAPSAATPQAGAPGASSLPPSTAQTKAAGASAQANGAASPSALTSAAAPSGISPRTPLPKTSTKTPSGLEYSIIKEGTGNSPTLGSKVQVHVTGWLPDGKVFLDTRGVNVPKEYRLDSLSLVKGWVETLLSMRTGEKRRVKVPSELAYGAAGLPQLVPPRSDVEFEIELVSFTAPGSAR